MTSATGESRSLEQSIDRIMAPARAVSAYQVPGCTAGMSRDQVELQAAVCLALFDAQLPAHIGNFIAERIATLWRELEHASPGELAEHRERSAARLQRHWGGAYAARVAQVAQFLALLTLRHPLVRAMMDRTPWMLTDALIADQLWQVLHHRRQNPL